MHFAPLPCTVECSRPQSAQKKALDVLNSVGLGESVLRMIERRQRLDTYTAYGGMVSVELGQHV